MTLSINFYYATSNGRQLFKTSEGGACLAVFKSQGWCQVQQPDPARLPGERALLSHPWLLEPLCPCGSRTSVCDCPQNHPRMLYQLVRCLISLPFLQTHFKLGWLVPWLVQRAKPNGDLGLAPLVLVKMITAFRAEELCSYWKEFCRQRAGGGEQK